MIVKVPIDLENFSCFNIHMAKLRQKTFYREIGRLICILLPRGHLSRGGLHKTIFTSPMM
jgi:hypothetical protein